MGVFSKIKKAVFGPSASDFQAQQAQLAAEQANEANRVQNEQLAAQQIAANEANRVQNQQLLAQQQVAQQAAQQRAAQAAAAAAQPKRDDAAKKVDAGKSKRKPRGYLSTILTGSSGIREEPDLVTRTLSAVR